MRPEERLADALAAYDDRLAAGADAGRKSCEKAVDPALLPRVEPARGVLDARRASVAPRVKIRMADNRPRIASRADYPQKSATQPRTRQSPDAGHRSVRPLPDPPDPGPGGLRDRVPRLGPDAAASGRAQGPAARGPGDARGRKRFLREAHAAAGLDHPNIVPVYETGSVGTVAYIAAGVLSRGRRSPNGCRAVRPVPVRDAAETGRHAGPGRRTCPRARRPSPRPEAQEHPAPAPGPTDRTADRTRTMP